jgi:hypothetical protein
MAKVDYSDYLRKGEIEGETISRGTLRKRKFDAEKREAERLPSATEWTENWRNDYPEEAKELREHVITIERKVREELQWPPSTFETFGWSREKYAETFPMGDTPEADAVRGVACVLFCLQKSHSPFVRTVHSPDGILAGGGCFPDVIGSGLVDAAHKYDLERSPTYARAYRELLLILDKKFGRNNDEHSQAVKQELAGKAA